MSEETGLEIIANVTRVVTKVVDRISGDRVEVPLMVAATCQSALGRFGIQSQVMYGPAAWVELMEDHSLVWAGCWGKNIHFWVATQFGEVVDLNASVAFRKRLHDRPEIKAIGSPPMLWSKEVPAFYRYRPEGVAELELTAERDQKQFEAVLREIEERCRPEKIAGAEPEFPNEPILCPGRRVLDDTKQSFKIFERALSIRGIPVAPF